MRNLNPITDRQIRLLEAVRDKICQINDPDPEVIIDESYEFHVVATKQFGKIPKIRFTPNSCHIKAELAKKSGIIDESKEMEIVCLRHLYGVTGARNSRARLFEEEWNNMMLKAKKAAFTVALINQLFATMDQTASKPIQLLQQIIMDEYAPQIKAKKDPIGKSKCPKASNSIENEGIKPYDQELSEHE